MIAKFIDRPREDSLTAAVFGHLLHLPIEMAWGVLADACGSLKQPTCPGEPSAVHDWPSWNAAGTRRSERVVPDLLIRFEGFDLIIEAKRWDVPMQDVEQWRAEFQAYLNEYGNDRRPAHMLALGGTHSHLPEPITATWCENHCEHGERFEAECVVHMCQWSSLLLACRRQKRHLERQAEVTSAARAQIRVIEDIIRLFTHHGFWPLSWFEDFSFASHLLSDSLDAIQKRFRAASQHYLAR